MAFRSILFAVALPYIVLAIQVTPNSPCSSVCVDSTTLDLSDPNSSNTLPSTIVCGDADFINTSDGKKWDQCMTCLQSSTFVQGGESDQYWFLYNLRYIFDHCVFGYANGTDHELTPCATEAACGPLKTGLEYGNMSTAGSEFRYCDTDGESVTGDHFEDCHSCVSSSGTNQYVANMLVALKAGCEQRPNVTSILGLDDVVFSSADVSTVDPASLVVDSTSASVQLSTAAIAGIAVGAVVLILIVAGCILIQCHKRKKRAAVGTVTRWGSTPKTHKRNSSFSFRCRNILTSPISPRFFFRDELSPVEEETKQYGSLNEVALSPGVVSTGDEKRASDRYYIDSKPEPHRYAYEPAWSPRYAPPTFQSFTFPPGSAEEPIVGRVAAVTPDQAPIETQPKSQRYAYEPIWSPQLAPQYSQSFTAPSGGAEAPIFPAEAGVPSKMRLSRKASLGINTNLCPPQPAHPLPKQDTFSVLLAMSGPPPQALPLRSTSYSMNDLRSNASSPCHSTHSRSRPKMTTMSSQGSGYPGPKSPTTVSPQTKSGWPVSRDAPGGWVPPPPPPGLPRLSTSSSTNYGRKNSAIGLNKAAWDSGSPVESKQVQVSFSVPPRK